MSFLKVAKSGMALSCMVIDLLHIKFAGEGAIDYGGPRREFFRLLGNSIRDNYFRGEENQKFFCQNVSAIQVGHLLYIII